MTRHEGSEASGRLLFLPVGGGGIDAQLEGEALDLALSSEDRVRLSDTRRARRLLEASGAQHLLCWHSTVVGTVGRPPTPEDYSVRFGARGTWELLRGPDRLITTRYGVPALPLQNPLHGLTVQTRAQLGLSFPELWDAVLLTEFVEAAERLLELRRGAVFVLTEDVEAEVERLSARCIRIAPRPVTSDLLVQLAAVDGATMIGTDGNIHAFGAILDGTADEGEGNRARGSRFNSSLTYARRRHDAQLRVAVFVISEDGGLTCLPWDES